MRSVISGLLLSLLAVSGLGLAASKAEAQLLPWRRPRYYYPAPVYYYSPPAVSYAAPVVSVPAVSYYYSPAVAYYYPAPAYSAPVAPAPSYYAAAPAPSSVSAYGSATVPSAGSSGTVTSTSNYFQPEAAGPTVNIRLQELEFQPATMNIFAGTTVAWHNDSATAHTVTSDMGLFDSREIPPGRSFRYTFNQPGTYQYHCGLHPQMHGTIVVQ